MGSALNANLHLHLIVPDAVFVHKDGAQSLQTIELPPPTDDQIVKVLQKIARRTTDLVQRYFGTLEDGQDLMGGAIYEAMVARPNLAVADGDEQQP